MVTVELNETGAGMSAVELVQKLMVGEPSIHVGTSSVYEGSFSMSPMCLRDGDAEAIGSRMRALLG